MYQNQHILRVKASNKTEHIYMCSPQLSYSERYDALKVMLNYTLEQMQIEYNKIKDSDKVVKKDDSKVKE